MITKKLQISCTNTAHYKGFEESIKKKYDNIQNQATDTIPGDRGFWDERSRFSQLLGHQDKTLEAVERERKKTKD